MKVTAPIPAHNEEATIEAAVAHANAARVSSDKAKKTKRSTITNKDKNVRRPNA